MRGNDRSHVYGNLSDLTGCVSYSKLTCQIWISSTEVESTTELMSIIQCSNRAKAFLLLKSVTFVCKDHIWPKKGSFLSREESRQWKSSLNTCTLVCIYRELWESPCATWLGKTPACHPSLSLLVLLWLLGQTDSHAPMLFDMARQIAQMKRRNFTTHDSLSHVWI